MTNETRPKAVLVGLHLSSVSDEEFKSSMAELGRLVHTLGYDVLATLSQKRGSPVAATIVGEGKLKELARLTGGTGVVASKAPARKGKNHEDAEDAAAMDDDEVGEERDDDGDTSTGHIKEKAQFVIFDMELTPNQLRNLESATGAEILDRTGVIVEIFHRHAKTREARLQVEIARLKYLAPRLRQARGGADRQGGGIGAKGVGETAHELDKRRIRDRIAEINRELENIHTSQEERRHRRSEQAKIALVGYTNAGKSSLMRALTGSEVLVEDKLFATLDTTIRAMHPETHPRILVSDTVGFIKKLPHDLVASFRSTLDEAADASLLLFVVDAADATFRSQLQVTRDVLGEIGANQAPSMLILNKVDCIDTATKAKLKHEFPDAIQISTRNKNDVSALRELIIGFFEKNMTETDLLVPYNKSEVLGDIRRSMRVIKESHGETGTMLRVRATPEVLAKISKQLKVS